MTPRFKWQRHGGHAFAAGAEGPSGQQERAREGLLFSHASQNSGGDDDGLHAGASMQRSRFQEDGAYGINACGVIASGNAHFQSAPQPRSPPCHGNPFIDANAQEGSTSDWSRTFAQTPSSRTSRFAQSFKELRELGRGNFSKVFMVQAKLDGCTYAVKRTIRSVERSYERRHAAREVQAHAAVGDHPNIVRYFSSWTESNHLYIQLELCEGILSAEVDAMRPLPEQRALEVVRHIGSALDHMHLHSVCHLDVKPGNMYWHGSKQLYKLGDLGLATRRDTMAIEDEGDARYMALELMQSKACNLDKADVFSLGASVYELLRGCALPANGPTWHQIRKGKAPMQGIPAQAQKTVTSMLAADPSARPPAEQLARMHYPTKASLPLR